MDHYEDIGEHLCGVMELGCLLRIGRQNSPATMDINIQMPELRWIEMQKEYQWYGKVKVKVKASYTKMGWDLLAAVLESYLCIVQNISTI